MGFKKGHKTNVGRPSPKKGRKEIKTSGKNHWNWKGGRQTRSYGYVLVHSPDHPYKTARSQVSEHRLVMEKILGRYLEPHEIVHHVNSIRDDNRPENLRLVIYNKNWHSHKCPKCDFEFNIK